MFDIAICNDTVSELEYLDYLLSAYRLEHPWPAVGVRRFQSLYDLVDCIRAGRTFSLYILGYRSESESERRWMNDLSPEAVLRREEPRGEIIAIASGRATALTPAAGDPLRLAAVLARPVQGYYLYPVLDRFIEANQDKDSSLQSCLTFTTSAPRKKLSLPYERISHMVYKRHKVTCWLTDKTSEVSPELREPFYQMIRPLLRDPRFIQVSAAVVVNLDFVERITKKPPRVWMANGESVKAAADAVDGVLKEHKRYTSQPGKKRVEPFLRDFSEKS